MLYKWDVWSMDESKHELPLLYTLTGACRKFFHGTRINERVLRKEEKAGRLEITRIGCGEYVTEQAIKEMVRKCQGPRNRQGCDLKGAKAAARSGPSSMPAQQSGPEYPKRIETPLPACLQRTFAKKKRPPLAAKVIQLKSPSPKS